MNKAIAEAQIDTACTEIDQRANEAEQQLMQDAMQALLAGDEAGRTRLLNRIDDVKRARFDAKIEAGKRILEHHGISRERSEAVLNRMFN